MPLLILFTFIAVPIAEIALLIWVGQYIGWLPTILLVILTAIIGTTLLRQQGFGVMARASEAIAAGRMPVEHVIEGMCLLVAGAFLITPGLITDTVGFLLLIPGIRIVVARFMLDRLLKSGMVHVSTSMGRGGHRAGVRLEEDEDIEEVFRRPPQRPGDGPIIEGDYERMDEEDAPSDRKRKR